MPENAGRGYIGLGRRERKLVRASTEPVNVSAAYLFHAHDYMGGAAWRQFQATGDYPRRRYSSGLMEMTWLELSGCMLTP